MAAMRVQLTSRMEAAGTLSAATLPQSASKKDPSSPQKHGPSEVAAACVGKDEGDAKPTTVMEASGDGMDQIRGKPRPGDPTASPTRGCLPLAHPRALPAVVYSDRRSPSAMHELPFGNLGLVAMVASAPDLADFFNGSPTGPVFCPMAL